MTFSKHTSPFKILTEFSWTTCCSNKLLAFTASCTCGTPPPINNGQFNPPNGPWNCNTFVNYQCNSGFSLEGNSRLQCGGNRAWSGPAPICRQGLCLRIHYYSNKHILYSDTSSGSRGKGLPLIGWVGWVVLSSSCGLDSQPTRRRGFRS